MAGARRSSRRQCAWPPSVIEPFHTGRTGPASAVWFDGGDLFGHPIEVLAERPEELLGFYSMVRAASEGWDGQDPYRPITVPPQ